jgi:electron transfer flavoprotein alpha/beta subunit
VCSAVWLVQAQHNNAAEEKSKRVFVCDLQLEEGVEREVDRLLEFFSCPMPALVSLSKAEQRRQMQMKGITGNDDENYYAMLAHCSNFKDLQCLASACKEWLEKRQQEYKGKRKERK